MSVAGILVFAKKICKTKILVEIAVVNSLQILDLDKKFLKTKILQKIIPEKE